MSHYSVKEIAERIKARGESVVVGKQHVFELAVISLLCGGHILIDDVPGTGKTVLAKTCCLPTTTLSPLAFILSAISLTL